MTDPKPDDRLVEFDRLNWLGKAIFIGGQAARALETVVDTVVEGAATLFTEAEHAFRQGLDSSVEDAKILEEHRREGKPPRVRRKSARDDR